MNVKERIDALAAKVKGNEKLQKLFQEDPVKAVKSLVGGDIPDDVVKQIADGVKTKLAADDLGGAVNKVKGLFGR